MESQIAVFAKSSFQQHLIGPGNPRAIYFNDAVAVGFVPGGPLLEIASEDPEQGTIFYTLNQWKSASPRLMRRNDCLTCHESHDTLGVPGMLLRSVYPAPNGFVMRELGNYNIDHRVPFAHRWGGFFVTGKTDALGHLGNAGFKSEAEAESVETNLKGYLAPSSDIVALMVFDHQMHMTNLLTRIGWETRFALHEKTMTPDKLAGMAKEIADYMLFVEEARISSPVQGTAGFEEKFAAQGPFDKKGRSLRQFDLSRRMMRYPCSYMIYSAAFDALPVETRKMLFTAACGRCCRAKFRLDCPRRIGGRLSKFCGRRRKICRSISCDDTRLDTVGWGGLADAGRDRQSGGVSSFGLDGSLSWLALGPDRAFGVRLRCDGGSGI